MASITSLTRVSIAVLVAALGLLIAALALTFSASERALSGARWSLHTHDVIAAASAALQRVTDAETASRGYALTGDPEFLAPAQGAAAEARARLAQLHDLVVDNPDQQRRSELLQTLATQRLDHSQRVIDAAQRSLAEGRALVAAGEGKELMGRYRDATSRFEATEEALLRERNARMEQAAASTRMALALLSITALALVGVAALVGVQALRRLRESEVRARLGEARLRVTLLSCGDAIIATDAEGRISMLNPVAQALTGWRLDQARDLPVDQVFRIVNEITREGVESPVGRVLREGKVVGLANHTLLIARDGSERPIDDSGAPIRDDDGEMVGVILVFRDVSGRKASEAARERLMRAEAEREAAVSANQAKDDFLALISHELRTPLSAMRGWLDLLIDGLLPEAERRGALQRILRNAQLQERLISDLLDISRIRSGKLDVLLAPLNVVQTATAALAGCESFAREKDVALRSELPDAPIFVKGDEDRLVQVIQNLVSNAIKFTPRGGVVRLSVARREGSARISVSDTGIGLAPDVREHIFDRFWQVESSIRRGHGGLGLGLTISKYLVEEHEGTIAGASDGPGRGSTFHVDLPLPERLAIAAPTDRTAGDAPELDGIRVLVVDDEEDARLAVVTYLRLLGASVAVASSVETALAALREQPQDVILSDIGMPGESGLALVRRLREEIAEFDRGRVFLVAMTAFTSVADRRAALESGFDAQINKPVDLDALAALLHAAVEHPQPS